MLMLAFTCLLWITLVGKNTTGVPSKFTCQHNQGEIGIQVKTQEIRTESHFV